MRVLMCVVALSATAALVIGQERVPAQPDPAQPKAVRPVQPVQPLPAQPIQPRPIPVTAARVTQLEEEVETVEAARDVKKAHIRAAEVAVQATAETLELVKAAGAAVSKTDAMKAKFEVEMAKAQLEIRVAELKEIEVKVKFAKKRLDEAKLNGVRPVPVPGVRPVPVDPVPDRAAPARPGREGRDAADDKPNDVEALTAKLNTARAEAKRAAQVSAVAEIEAKEAKAELERVLDIAMRGRVAAGTIEKAKDKAAAAQQAADLAAKKAAALKDEVAKLEKELEKARK